MMLFLILAPFAAFGVLMMLTTPAISLFAAEHKEPWGEIAAASVLATLPLLVATLMFHRRVVAGLTAGAVKG